MPQLPVYQNSQQCSQGHSFEKQYFNNQIQIPISHRVISVEKSLCVFSVLLLSLFVPDHALWGMSSYWYYADSIACLPPNRVLLTLHLDPECRWKNVLLNILIHTLCIYSVATACRPPRQREFVFKKKRHTNGWHEWGFLGVFLRSAVRTHRKSLSPVNPSVGVGVVVVEAFPEKAAETQQEFTRRSGRRMCQVEQGQRPR